MSYEIDSEPISRRLTCKDENTLLAAVCGGEGTCGHCDVRVIQGEVASPIAIEALELEREGVAAGWNQARQTIVGSDVLLHFRPEFLTAAQRTQTEGRICSVDLAPAVHVFEFPNSPPTLGDLRPDAAHVRDAIPLFPLTFDPMLRRVLPSVLRQYQFHGAAFANRDQVIAVGPTGTTPMGLGVDIGTTRLAAYLPDLSDSKPLAVQGTIIPRFAFGEGVLARINHATSSLCGLEQLRVPIVNSMNAMARDLCSRVQRETVDIADAVLVGNTAMHHLFVGLSARQIGLALDIAGTPGGLDLKAREGGLDLAPGAFAHLLPSVAEFVGGDHIAKLMATDLFE